MARPRSVLQEPVSRPLILGTLFVAAFCLRLYGIGAPPMDFQGVRQYHGVLLRTGFLRVVADRGPEDDTAGRCHRTANLGGSGSALLLGPRGEHLSVPRLLSALFWMVGGIFL
jgi:hypothetical protein